MNKKVGAGVLTSVMALGVLAGCGGGGTGAGEQKDAQGGAASGGTTELRLYTYGTEQAYNWSQTVAAYEKQNPGIKVNVIGLSDKGDTQEALKKLDLAAASGEAMDVLMFSDAASYSQRVALGMVAPMDDYIAKDGFKVTEDYKVDTKINGKYYALPGKFNPWYVLLNKNMLDEAGLKVPTDWTWDDFMDYAKKMTKGEGANKVYGTYFHGPQNGGWVEYAKLALENQADNPDFIKADGSSNLDNPLFKKSLEIRLKMEKQDQSATPYTDMLSQKLNYRTQFFNQKAAMIAIGSWMNSELGGTDQVPLNFNIAVAPFPKNNAGDQGGYSPVATDYVSVAASSKHKDEAYKFIRWYTTEGQLVQGKNVPAWSKVKQEDMSKIIDTILSGTKNPEKVDKASLISVLGASKSGTIVPPATYQAEINKMVNEEFEKMVLGKQDLDTTVKAAQDRINSIIASNKK
ncbi:Putative ABC transporter substrate-binding protein YesO [Paenibacillus konkukensis]|uniref:ABC transporter substrate-binding protein YesO n=1 Tax=Paenibacillus konkukensis TaxID=2020716 RepID=A0ABY4RGW7_9BACL|nr:sugar ABC transporter substrate-binding protein [Paenibacillus konkukensis]UQZ81467.1 Putative ABC transporter substrate-binding protein YesO [Paenibacillus konkukensis]